MMKDIKGTVHGLKSHRKSSLDIFHSHSRREEIPDRIRPHNARQTVNDARVFAEMNRTFRNNLAERRERHADSEDKYLRELREIVISSRFGILTKATRREKQGELMTIGNICVNRHDDGVDRGGVERSRPK